MPYVCAMCCRASCHAILRRLRAAYPHSCPQSRWMNCGPVRIGDRCSGKRMQGDSHHAPTGTIIARLATSARHCSVVVNLTHGKRALVFDHSSGRLADLSAHPPVHRWSGSGHRALADAAPRTRGAGETARRGGGADAHQPALARCHQQAQQQLVARRCARRRAARRGRRAAAGRRHAAPGLRERRPRHGAPPGALPEHARHGGHGGAADGAVRHRRRHDRDLRLAIAHRRHQPGAVGAGHFDRALQHRLRSADRDSGTDVLSLLSRPRR